MDSLSVMSNDKLFGDIISNYKKINSNLDNMLEDLDSLNKIHHEYVSNSNKKQKFSDYGIYVDDVFFQIKILKEEHACMHRLYLMCFEKFYRDLFKLYSKVVNKLIGILIDNVEVLNKLDSLKDKNQQTSELLGKFLEKFEISKISNPDGKVTNLIDEITSQQKTKYYKKIRLYKELATNTYTIDEIKTLFGELTNRLGELKDSSVLISTHINEMTKSSNKGLLIQTYIISLTGEKHKIEVDWDVYSKILVSILNTQLSLSKKYVVKTEKIANEYMKESENSNPNVKPNLNLDSFDLDTPNTYSIFSNLHSNTNPDPDVLQN